MPSRYRFAQFELLGTERQLRVDGHEAPLGARAFDLLVALIERRDRTVGKDELIGAVWPGLVVEDNNLQVQISALRKVLGPRAIATIPGRGYRFALEVSALAAGPEDATRRAAAAVPGPPTVAVTRPQQGNLPEVLPELIGRAADVASLLAAIGAHPLVSVVGAAGIGKTRLAQAAAHALRREFEDGVWMVELAPVADPALLPTAVAQAMGVTLPGKQSAQEEVVDALRHRALLLVLDNCEHLLDAAGAFARALRDRAPGARDAGHQPGAAADRRRALVHAAALSLPATPD